MPIPKINGPKKKAAPKGGFFTAENAPLVIGGVLGGAALLLYMNSRNQNVSVGPALTLNPSTSADESTIANLNAAVKAIANNRKNPPVTGANPNPVPNPPPIGGGGGGGTPVTPTTPRTNGQWLDFFNAFFNNWTHNLPTGGNGSGGLGTSPPPSQTGSSNPLAYTPPGVNSTTSPGPLGLGGLTGTGYGGTNYSPYTLAAGIVPGGSPATPAQSNAVWSAISRDVNALPAGASVRPLNIQGTAAVSNSAAPEQVATKEEYQGLVLGQYAGGTGQYAPGAPVDVSKGSTPESNAMTVDYLKGIQASGSYNPDLPAISSKAAVAQELYSMTGDPVYLNDIHY